MDLPFYMAVHNEKTDCIDTLFSQNYFLIFPLLRNTLPVNTKSSSNVLNCFDERLIDARNVSRTPFSNFTIINVATRSL